MVDEIQAKAARTLNRQEIGEQRAVQQVDRKGTTADIATPGAVIVGEHIAEISLGAPGINDEFGNRDGVAQSKVEALSADRRDHVSGFANQRDAIGRKLL